MAECDDYVKAFSDVKAFLTLQCRASGASYDLCIRLLRKCCACAIEYGRATYSVRDSVIAASVGNDCE